MCSTDGRLPSGERLGAQLTSPGDDMKNGSVGLEEQRGSWTVKKG